MNDYQALEMRKKLTNIFFNKQLRLRVSFEQHDYTHYEINQSCEDSLEEFMIENFSADWRENDYAMSFYENVACDILISAQNDAIELYQQLNS